jgi:dihydroflavonol-4-reductase
MRVLVTGANGHLGYNLCTALVEQGCEVRGSIRSLADDAKAAPLRALGDIELAGLDVRNAEAFARAAEGVEILFADSGPSRTVIPAHRGQRSGDRGQFLTAVQA